MSFSPTGYCKKSVLLALSYINCLSKDFVHIQFLQYFKLILMLLFLWKVYEQNKHFLKEASFLCIIWNNLNNSPISDPHQKIQVGKFLRYFLSKNSKKHFKKSTCQLLPVHQSSTLCLSHTEVNSPLFGIDLLKSPSFRVPPLMLKMYTVNTTGTMVTSTGTLWFRTFCYCFSVMIWYSRSIQSIVHSLKRLAPCPPPTKRILISTPLLNVIIVYYDLLFPLKDCWYLSRPMSNLPVQFLQIPLMVPAPSNVSAGIKERQRETWCKLFLWQRGHTIFFYATTKTRTKCHRLGKGSGKIPATLRIGQVMFGEANVRGSKYNAKYVMIWVMDT